MKRIAFYALRNDVLAILNHLEAAHPVRYIDINDYKNPVPKEWCHGRDIPGLGHATSETGHTGDQFLIIEAGVTVNHSASVQRDGTKRFDIHQVNNPQSIILAHAGEWSEEIILAGEFVTMSTTPLSQALMRSAYAGIRATFTKIGKHYWVGPEAFARFKAGARLTMAEQSPPEFDLKESSQEEGEDRQSQAKHKTSTKADYTVLDMKDFRRMFGGS